MLVLSRKIGEQIMIGDQIALTVTKIEGHKMSLGIDAPRDIIITRGEHHNPPQISIAPETTEDHEKHRNRKHPGNRAS